MRYSPHPEFGAELAEWLQGRRRETDLPVSRIIRHQLERAKSESGDKPFLRAEFHLRCVSYVLSLVEDGVLRLALEMAAHQQRLTQLVARYQDRQPDSANLCLIRMSELFPRHTVITVDEADFRIYRQNTRETVPILCPPRFS